MLHSLAIVVLSTSALVADAHAQAPGETTVDIVEQPPPPVLRISYRRQLMIADGIAAGTVGVAIAAGTWIYEPDDFHAPVMVGALGFGGYLLAAPIIHFAHGRVWRGLLSGGARILFPAVGSATVTTALGYEDGSEDRDGWAAAFGSGFALGAVGAMALDWFVLTPSTELVQHTSFVAPTASVSPDHVFLGVAGSL